MDIQEAGNRYIEERLVFKKLAEKVAQIIEEVLELEKVNYHVVTYRAKTVESFSEKIKNPKYNDPLKQLTDLAGIRIIGYVEDDITEISQIIKKVFIVDHANSLDKGLELGIDQVGYKSVHYVCSLPKNRIKLPEYARFDGIKFEIQIRTILQHSWAEIEHDKNYKFSGQLPKEIQRRFKLLAGSLEMADREFNQLSREIDEYSSSVKDSTEKGELNIPINSTSLKQFLNIRFDNLIKNGNLKPTFLNSKSESFILEEFKDFGIHTLANLDKIISPKFSEVILELPDDINFLGLSRIIMIANNANKYMVNSFKNHWTNMDKKYEVFLEKLGVDINEIQKHIDKTNKKVKK